MNYIGNFKFTQFIMLFQILKDSLKQNLSIFGAGEGVCFNVQIMEGLEIHLEIFKPTWAHLSLARLCVACHHGHYLTCTRHFASDHAHRAVSTAKSVAAGDCRLMWVAGLNPACCLAGAEPPLHFCLLVHASSSLCSLPPLLLLGSPSSATTIPLHHRPSGGSSPPSFPHHVAPGCSPHCRPAR
jgi:hypothetical protein